MTKSKLQKKYRITTKLMEILEIISEAKNYDGNFLWHIVEEKRYTYPVQITDFKIDADKVLIGVENKSTRFEIGQITYMRLPGRDAVFKSKIQQLNDFEVILSFPVEVLASERRRDKRHPFHLVDEKMIQVRTADGKTMNCKTLDVSERGVSIFVSKEMQASFEKDALITIEALGDYKLNPPERAKVAIRFAHSLKHAMAIEKGFRVGLELEKNFPEAPFTKFLVRPTLHEISDERLVVDAVFRAKVHDIMGATVQNLIKKRVTKGLLKNIDFDRADNDYIKVHIKLLCEILCGVGTKMGWVSDKTMDKLIYIAYMHDIRLLQKPELAKIQSKVELDRNADKFTPEEIKMYLEAPAYAAEIARMDQESYSDAVKILIQQRELPDGSGFPHKITSLQMAPLSCLFIFSHYLVDYMIENPEWKLESFLKAYQRLLKGSYFTKIFQMLAEN